MWLIPLCWRPSPHSSPSPKSPIHKGRRVHRTVTAGQSQLARVAVVASPPTAAAAATAALGEDLMLTADADLAPAACRFATWGPIFAVRAIGAGPGVHGFEMSPAEVGRFKEHQTCRHFHTPN